MTPKMPAPATRTDLCGVIFRSGNSEGCCTGERYNKLDGWFGTGESFDCLPSGGVPTIEVLTDGKTWGM